MTENGIELVDMCSLQAPDRVDFNKVRDSGIRGVYFKASQYSASDDPTFAVGVERAMAAGLVCGAYHFAYCGSDAIKQMEHFYKASGGLGSLPGELPPMLDWEFAVNGSDGKPLTKSGTVLWLAAALDHMWSLWYARGERRPTAYTYPFFADERQPWLSQVQTLASYPLTLAAYPSITKIPKPWDRVTIHQYVGNGGKVPGVPVDCDRDRFLGTEEEFQAFLGNTPGPTGNKLVPDEVTTGSGGIIHPFPETVETWQSRESGAV